MVSKSVNLRAAGENDLKQGTCVLAVVMTQAFEPGTLPGRQPRPSAMPTDVSSFGVIVLAAHQIQMDCLFRDHALGWWPVGKLRPTRSPTHAPFQERK